MPMVVVKMTRAEMIEELKDISGHKIAASADRRCSDDQIKAMIEGARQQKALYEQAAARRAAWEREAQKSA